MPETLIDEVRNPGSLASYLLSLPDWPVTPDNDGNGGSFGGNSRGGGGGDGNGGGGSNEGGNDKFQIVTGTEIGGLVLGASAGAAFDLLVLVPSQSRAENASMGGQLGSANNLIQLGNFAIFDSGSLRTNHNTSADNPFSLQQYGSRSMQRVNHAIQPVQASPDNFVNDQMPSLVDSVLIGALAFAGIVSATRYIFHRKLRAQ